MIFSLASVIMVFNDGLLVITSEILLLMIVGAAQRVQDLGRGYFRIYFEKINFNSVINT